MPQKIIPTNQEIMMRDDAFIVTKTDSVGRLTYCNPTFIEFSGYTEAELIGKQHNIVRHPDMPRAVFALLWQTIQTGNEFWGYVKNLSKNGAFYWVLANVTPSYDPVTHKIIGYYSVRRKPARDKVATIASIYQQMLAAEQAVDRQHNIAAGTNVLNEVVTQSGKDYREFIFML